MKSKILKALERNQNVVLIYKKYGPALDKLYLDLSKNFDRICVVNFKKSVSSMVKKFESKGIDSSNYYFVDCSSAKSNTKIKCLGKENIKDLIDLDRKLRKAIRKNKIEVIVFDDVSTLLKKEKQVFVLKFLNLLMKTLREDGSKAVYAIASKDLKGSMGAVDLFSDEAIVA